VDIAKLRLWLSLVVDEEDFGTIKPLPNLEYKIVAGDSLLGVEQDLFNSDLFRQLEALKDQYFDETRPSHKAKLKARIDGLITEIAGPEGRFDYKINFSEVFRGRGGFDIVIANPPYVGAVQFSKEQKQDTRKLYKDTYDISGAFDLYILFVIKGKDLLSKNGQSIFIVPNKLKIAQYAQKTLSLLKEKSNVTILDVSTFDAFKGVGVYPIIITCYKSVNINYTDIKVDSFKELEERKYQQNSFNIDNPTIQEYGLKVASGLTGFQAHSIIPYIFNELDLQERGNAIPFLVSGSVDPYCIDTSKVRYMKHTFKNPYIVNNNNISDSKWSMWNTQKIIIAGMTKRIEAYFCDTPMAIGVGCYAITKFNNIDPWFLLGLLNSKLMTYYLIKIFKDKHLQGGYLAINKNTIEALPMPNNIKGDIEISKLSKLVQSDHGTQSAAHNQRKIDQLVYQLYGLTPEEIALVEGAVGA
jgi:adenine-specific DNA-methyltransferase